MKQSSWGIRRRWRKSPPARGAWIETTVPVNVGLARGVAPRAGGVD